MSKNGDVYAGIYISELKDGFYWNSMTEDKESSDYYGPFPNRACAAFHVGIEYEYQTIALPYDSTCPFSDDIERKAWKEGLMCAQNMEGNAYEFSNGSRTVYAEESFSKFGKNDSHVKVPGIYWDYEQDETPWASKGPFSTFLEAFVDLGQYDRAQGHENAFSHANDDSDDDIKLIYKDAYNKAYQNG